ncbi:MAG TPA: undecaprenyl-diphosphate phosphatase [Erysipelothrix sp.]
MLELLKVIILGIVEGITEWLPISSTGHMILVDEFLQLNMRTEFKDMFFVVIQLGAILSVVILYWPKLYPFGMNQGYQFQFKNLFTKSFYTEELNINMDIMTMWFKVLVASIPAGVVGILLDDKLDKFFNYKTVAIMLILFGVLFIIVETMHKGKSAKMKTVADITYSAAFIIGIWQMIAAVFPGTSRSGATIVGALMLGISRHAATEFTFFLAIPAMFGASLLKLVSFGFAFSLFEFAMLIVGMIVAFVVSILSIRFLLGYIKKNDFKAFGYYRIVLGIIVLVYFYFKG